MQKILPAIIPKSLEDITKSLENLDFAETVQIDLVDGIFTPSISWPYDPEGDVCEITKLNTDKTIELDLMIQNPSATALRLADNGMNRFIFHLESFPSSLEITALIEDLKHTYDATVGLAIQNDTPLEKLEPHIESCDFVQLMGIAEIGSQGQSFDERVLERIKYLKQQHPDVIIQIDGSVNEKTLPELKDAGANRFAIGSGILKAKDPQKTYNHLLSLLN